MRETKARSVKGRGVPERLTKKDLVRIRLFACTTRNVKDKMDSISDGIIPYRKRGQQFFPHSVIRIR